jgi:hypothetical protein
MLTKVNIEEAIGNGRAQRNVQPFESLADEVVVTLILDVPPTSDPSYDVAISHSIGGRTSGKGRELGT